jgi:transketolase
VLALSRQNLSLLRLEHNDANLSSRGAYVLKDSEEPARIIFIATGSEVEIAVAARDLVQAKGIAARVVTMPCWRLFDEQDEGYRAAVLGNDAIKIAIEAASAFGWERYIGETGAFIGIDHFGASAPYKELYRKFGITAEAAVEAALVRLEQKE